MSVDKSLWRAALQRKCFLLKVKAGKIDEYKKEHKNVWPEMLSALKKHGWMNYSLFLRKDGLLIGYVETLDWEASLKGMSQEPINTRW